MNRALEAVEDVDGSGSVHLEVIQYSLPQTSVAIGHRSRRPSDALVIVLVDAFGRVATDLRVSLTDRCNLRCVYCMPPEGLDWLPNDDVLTDAEGPVISASSA